MSAATLCTRLVSLYAFIRFLADEGVMSPELLKRKIHIKQPKRLPKCIEADDEDRILAQIDNVPIEVLRDLIGHQSLEHTRRYANLNDVTRKEEYFRAMAVIEGRSNE